MRLGSCVSLQFLTHAEPLPAFDAQQKAILLGSMAEQSVSTIAHTCSTGSLVSNVPRVFWLGQSLSQDADSSVPHLPPELGVLSDGVIVVVHPHQLRLVHCDRLVQAGTSVALQVLTIAVGPAGGQGKVSRG